MAVPLGSRTHHPEGSRHRGVHRPATQRDDPAHARPRAWPEGPHDLQRLLVLRPANGRGAAARPAPRPAALPPRLGYRPSRSTSGVGSRGQSGVPPVRCDASAGHRGRGLTMPPARLLSVNVGMPRDIQWTGRTVHTGIWKTPVPGRCRVTRLNLDGDGQGDLAGHGGEQRAVLVYQSESYDHWQAHLKRADFVYGQFGENFTVEGLADDAVCIGDRYRIGSAVFEVTQPRVTC